MNFLFQLYKLYVSSILFIILTITHEEYKCCRSSPSASPLPVFCITTAGRFEDLEIVGGIILMWILLNERQRQRVEWIHLAQEIFPVRQFLSSDVTTTFIKTTVLHAVRWLLSSVLPSTVNNFLHNIT